MTSARGDRFWWVGTALVAGVLVVGCGDDDERAVGSVEEWCALVERVDAGFESTDSSSDPFEVKQEEYAAINAQLDDLADSVDLVTPESRDAVETALTWATEMTDLLTGAESEEEAAELLFGEEGMLTEEQPVDPAGVEWILETCGVDIDGGGDETG